jgi:hypothetical protein
VVRTTADLDLMLAQAGLEPARRPGTDLAPKDLPPVPDTAESVADLASDRPGRSR